MEDQIQNEVQDDINTGQQQETGTDTSDNGVDDYSAGFNSIDDLGELSDLTGKAAEKTEYHGEKGEQDKSAQTKDDGEAGETSEQQEHGEEYETQKDNYKSLLGRHQRLQEETRLLREQQQRLSQSQQQKQPVFEKAEIPEELKDDVEAFKKQYPEYAGLIEIKGREGDSIRGLLAEYGANIAAVRAESLVTRLELAKSRNEVTQRVSEQVAISHEQQIYAAHPDFAALDGSGKWKYLEDIRDWIEDLPMKEARHWDAVYKNGDTKETIQLFNEFKRNRSQNDTTTQNNSKQHIKRRQAIEDGLAVPAGARQTSHLSRKTDKNDFSGGWNSIPD